MSFADPVLFLQLKRLGLPRCAYAVETRILDVAKCARAAYRPFCTPLRHGYRRASRLQLMGALFCSLARAACMRKPAVEEVGLPIWRSASSAVCGTS